MKYEILAFPSLHGTPWYTNYRWLAYLYTYWRGFNHAEAILYDRATGERLLTL